MKLTKHLANYRQQREHVSQALAPRHQPGRQLRDAYITRDLRPYPASQAWCRAGDIGTEVQPC